MGYYYEDLAQKVFDSQPDLVDENKVLDAGYKIAVQDLDSRQSARYLFSYDEDFPGDFVTCYFWLQKQEVTISSYY